MSLNLNTYACVTRINFDNELFLRICVFSVWSVLPMILIVEQDQAFCRSRQTDYYLFYVRSTHNDDVFFKQNINTQRDERHDDDHLS